MAGHAESVRVRGVVVGRQCPIGSKITPGPCAKMIENFIRAHP